MSPPTGSSTDTVSLSTAEEDAAMTLLSARNLFLTGNADLTSEWAKRGEGVTSGSSRSKRPPKPSRHKNDLAAYEEHSIQRKRTPSSQNRKGKDLHWMERHLETVHVGLGASEPSELDSLLHFNDSCFSAGNQATLRQGYYNVIDMRELSQEKLLSMAERTQHPHCLPPVLTPRAGVKQEKAASFSGQDAFYADQTHSPATNVTYKRHPSSKIETIALDLASDEEKQLLADKIQQIWRTDNNQVWKLVGRGDPPVVNRVQINYLRLFLVVEEFGGYDRALEGKKWSDVARNFGMEESNIGKNGHSLRMLYVQYIKPLSSYLSAHSQM